MIWLALIYGVGGAWLALNSVMELPARRITWVDAIKIAFVSTGWPIILVALGGFALFHSILGQARANPRGVSAIVQRNRQF